MICTLQQIFSNGQIKKDGLGGARGTYGRYRGAYRVLVGKYDGKKPFVRRRYRYEGNNRTDLKEIWLVA